MKFSEINRAFCDEVAKYLAKGYVINSGTMGGTQGELAKVDLTDGKEIIRVYLESGYDHRRSGYKLVTGRCANSNVEPNKIYGTIWNGYLYKVSVRWFYKMSDEWFVTPEEYDDIRAKRSERSKAEGNRIEDGNYILDYVKLDSDEAKKAVLPFVRRQPRCKTAKLDDIMFVNKVYKVAKDDCRRAKVCYTVVYKGWRQFKLGVNE